MRTVLRILALGRGHLRGFALVAMLVSLGTAASLLQPWVYRSIVDDVSGVFVAPPAMRTIEQDVERTASFWKHLSASGQRMFRLPLKHHKRERVGVRRLVPRSMPQAVATIVLGAILLLLARMFSEVCRWMGDNLSTRLASRIEQDFIIRTFRHVTRLPLSFFARRPSGTLAKQIDQSDQIAPFFTAFAQELWPDLFQLLAIIGLVASLNRELALIVMIAVPLYAFVSWRMSHHLETRLEQYYGLWDEVAARIQQGVSGIKTILGLGAAEHEAQEVDAAAGRAFGAYVERGRLENRYVFYQEAVITAARASTLLLAGIKALEHQLTPGDLVMLIAYLDRIFDPIENLTGLYTSLQENASAVQRAERLLAAPPAPGEDQPALRPGPGTIEFRDVHFAYRPGQPVLRGVTFRIGAGEHVGIVGPSGAGKTTLTDLLVGFYEPQQGQILLDGQRVSDVSPSSLHAAVRGVAADGVLFHLSVAENIRYGRFDATDSEVLDAAERAGLGPLLERLPEGLATPVGEPGVELSVGERQRILLARAFIARPTVLILDEATANLDFHTEHLVKEAIQVLARGRTTLVVAHRRSMMTDVDRVLVLRNGTIEQQGRPSDLVEREGYFRDMMNAAESAPAR
jgi:ABC-type multidrug transport system fused ATPase/permease subunit